MVCGLPCAHNFHVECIDQWLRLNVKCPRCHCFVFPNLDLSALSNVRADFGRSSASAITSTRYVQSQPSGHSYLLRLQGLLSPIRTENFVPENDADRALETVENGRPTLQASANPAVSVSMIASKLWRYYDYGPKEVPPLVCLPGTAETADVYYKQIMSLSMKLHECFGSVLGAMGPNFFLTLLPLNLEAQDSSEATWLFPILKQYTLGASLSFFRKSILGKVGVIKQKSRMHEQEGRIYSSRSAGALVYALWSLFPAFCNYPSSN